MNKKNKKQPELIIGKASGKTKMKTKLYFLVLLIGVGLIVTALVMKDNNDTSITESQEENQEITDQMEDSLNLSQDNSVIGDYLEGVLSISENARLGNFKLTSKSGDVYLRTSRDFSSLVGAQVLVIMRGTLENFELLDIQPAVQKDGYILPR